MDPLSDILRLTEVSAHLSAGMTGHGRWAVAFAPPVGVKFNFVRRGKCSLRVGDDVVELGEGDCFLLSARLPFVIATDLGALPRPASEVYAVLGEDGMAHVGERIGDDEHESVSLIGGRFDFGARARSVLVDHLPPVMRIDAARPEAAVIRTTLNDIDSEIRAARAGSGIVAESLALVMLAHAVRMYVADSSQNVTGLLAGLRDPVVAAAVSALHRQPAHPWSVAELASVVSVSRSTLAARFVRNVGSGPLAYLTTWRMELAAQQLRRGDDTLEAIAHDVGYGSDSAFSVAFKRVIGSSPNAYRRAAASTRTDLPNFSRT